MKINLRSNAHVLAAVPVLLGFVPTNSIVAIVFDNFDDRRTIHVAARYDATAPLVMASQFVDALPLLQDDGTYRRVLLIAIADTDHQHHAGDHLDTIARQITTRGAAIIKRLHTPAIDAGQIWTDIDTGEAGTTVDYRTSELVLQMAVDHSRPILASRADIAAEFAPGDPAPEAETLDDTAEFITHTVLGMYAAFNDPDLLTPQLAANTGHLITTSVAHRDALLVVSTSHPQHGATVWTRVARQLRSAARIEALALAATCFYAGDDAIRANIALEAAHDTAAAAGLDDTNLVQLLDTALQHGPPAGSDPPAFRPPHRHPARRRLTPAPTESGRPSPPPEMAGRTHSPINPTGMESPP